MRRTPATAAPTDAHETLGAILELLPSLFFKLNARTEALHARAGFTTGERGVLRDLIERGPMTVPELASLRPVSRQAIQQTADRLLRRQLIVAEPNPRHARSPLYAPTGRGRRFMADARRREAAARADASGRIPGRALAGTLATLRRIDALLGSTEEGAHP